MHRLVRLHNLERSRTKFSSDVLESVDITVQAGHCVNFVLHMSAKYTCTLRHIVCTVVCSEGGSVHILCLLCAHDFQSIRYEDSGLGHRLCLLGLVHLLCSL